MSRLRLLIVMIVFLLITSFATANDPELAAGLWGNLDWSSDGQYIAVGTSRTKERRIFTIATTLSLFTKCWAMTT